MPKIIIRTSIMEMYLNFSSFAGGGTLKLPSRSTLAYFADMLKREIRTWVNRA